MDPETFLRLSPREQASMLRRASPEEAARLAALVPDAPPSILDLRADALLQLGRAEEALSVVDAREKAGASSVSLGLRTRALAKLGRIELARAAVAASGAAESYLGRCILAEALLEAGEHADARALLQLAVAEHPYRRRALIALVDACGALGDWVSGSAFAGRLLDTQEGEGPLTPRYLQRLRAFSLAAGEPHRVAQIDAILATPAAPEAEPAALTAPPATPLPAPEPAPRAADVTESELASVRALVKRHLGFDALREAQGEVLVRVLRGEDVLAIMPTGGGKSLCYQLPAVLSSGVTLVVSPLIALMKDQLDGLPPAMRAASVAITSELTAAQARRALDEVAAGSYRLVYAAPERLRNPTLIAALRRAGVKRLVIDEAHCVSVWGHDFRPDYLAIGDARKLLGDPPVLALTATAPPRVERDIAHRLGDLRVVRASTARPNLRLEAILAKDADEKLAHLLQLCRETKGPGIVYASSRAKCEQLAEALQRAGLKAAAYHAGLEERARIQDSFMANEVDVLVATVAFGMGVDKPDIRFIFHHDPSTSLENYSQESGRAGRDGLPARCLLLATSADGGTLKQRARADLPGPELVEQAWQLARESAAEDGYAAIEPARLGALDPESDVKPRVALSVLVEAGALARLADAPRVVAIDRQEFGLFEAARRFGLPPESVEPRLLEREARGELFLQTGGRVLLHRVVGDASRVPAVLARYAALAEQRGKEIMDYARATTCRHAYLRAYFGEQPPPACGNCDVCLGLTHELPESGAAEEAAARKAVLNALSGAKGIGERNLVWHLRGDQRAPPWADALPARAALGMRSESKIKALVAELEAMRYIERETLPHGGQTLRLTDAGLDALFGDKPLVSARRTVASPPAATRTVSASAGKSPIQQAPGDGPAFESLRAWRREAADAEGVPPFVVAHDATLRAIAEARPGTLDALRAVKGMGPKKVEKYGAAILAALAVARDS